METDDKIAKGKRNKQLGKRGEDAAARFLELMGYNIIQRNWSCPAGEADIIAEDGATLVFIEVKTRSNLKKGFPSEAVTQKKRARYEKIACWYLRDYEYTDIPVRFDVIAIVAVSGEKAFLKHYQNAFQPGC